MRRTLLVAALLVCAVIGFAPAGLSQDATRPTILNVTMDAAGDQLTIVGTGFGSAPVVTIDGQGTPVLPGASDTQITVVTPAALLTTPGTYRLTVVDSVRQVGEVFVVTSRAGLVPAVSLTTGGKSEVASGEEAASLQPRASAGSAGAQSSVGTGPGISAVIEDPASPFRTAIGFQALLANTSGVSNTAAGYQALTANTTGGANTAVGASTLLSNTTGASNTATGNAALGSNTTGGNNTASGVLALGNNTNGYYNTADGYQALGANTTGGSNTASGDHALGASTTGSYNTAQGRSALAANTTASFNTASGYFALGFNTMGQSNAAFGYQALLSNASGTGNTASGVNALESNTSGDFNTAFGYNAGHNATTGGFNVYLGAGVTGLAGDANTMRLGAPFSALTGQKRTHIAGIRGTSLLGVAPVVIDANGQLGSTSVIALTDSGNVGIGTASPLERLDVVGTSGGSSRISVGSTAVAASDAAVRLRTGVAKSAFLFGAEYNVDNAFEITPSTAPGGTLFSNPAVVILNSGNVGIGTMAPANPLQMGSGAYVSAGGAWTNASSRTFKDHIAALPLNRALEVIERLEPVTFNYKASGEAHVGFIAEDVPDLVATPDCKSLSAMDIVAVLTKVVQDQQQQLLAQAQQLHDLAELRARLARLEAVLAR